MGRWTRTAPTLPGWYWHKSDLIGAKPTMVEVIDMPPSGLLVAAPWERDTHNGYLPPDRIPGAAWSGPLNPPLGN